MNKRGTLQVYYLYEVIVAVLIVTMLIIFARNIATGEDIKMIYLTKDSALMIDALHAVPGNVVFKYQSQNLTDDLQMSILDNSVQLVPKYGPPYSFPFRPGIPEIKSDEFTLSSGRMNILDFIKTGSEIHFGKDIAYTEKVSCPSITTKDENWKYRKIILDPQEGGKYVGNYFKNINESDLNLLVGLNLKTLLHLATAELTRKEKDEERTIQERIEIAEKSSMIISIGFGPPLPKENPLKIQISNSDKSRKLACLISNNLAKEFDSVTIDISFDNTLLRADIPSVSIELGSINESSKNKIATYADGIYNAIKTYYE